MTTDTEAWKMKSIADYYGLDTQMDQLTEEMGELLQAISKHRRHQGKGQPLRKAFDPGNLAEELADVSIVLEEVMYLLGKTGEVRRIREKKINRALDAIPHCGTCKYIRKLVASWAPDIDMPDEDCNVCTALMDLYNSDKVPLIQSDKARCDLYIAK